MEEAQNLRISHFGLPIFFGECIDDGLDKLLHTQSPIANPFHLAPHDEGIVDSFSLKGPDFVRAYTFGKPNSSVRGYVLVKALIKKHTAPDAMRNGPAESTEGNSGIRKVLEPSLPLRICKGNTWRWFEGGGRRNLAKLSPLIQDACEYIRERL